MQTSSVGKPIKNEPPWSTIAVWSIPPHLWKKSPGAFLKARENGQIGVLRWLHFRISSPSSIRPSLCGEARQKSPKPLWQAPSKFKLLRAVAAKTCLLRLPSSFRGFCSPPHPIPSPPPFCLLPGLLTPAGPDARPARSPATAHRGTLQLGPPGWR